MEQVHEAEALERAEEWEEALALAAVEAVVLRQAQAATAYARTAGKEPFIKWVRLVMSSNAQSVELL